MSISNKTNSQSIFNWLAVSLYLYFQGWLPDRLSLHRINATSKRLHHKDDWSNILYKITQVYKSSKLFKTNLIYCVSPLPKKSSNIFKQFRNQNQSYYPMLTKSQQTNDQFNMSVKDNNIKYIHSNWLLILSP